MNNFLENAQRDLPQLGWGHELDDNIGSLTAQHTQSNIMINISEDGVGIEIWKIFYLYNSAREQKQMLLGLTNNLNIKCNGIKYALHIDNKGVNYMILRLKHPFEYNKNSFAFVLKTWEHDYNYLLEFANDLNQFFHTISKIGFERFDILSK